MDSKHQTKKQCISKDKNIKRINPDNRQKQSKAARKEIIIPHDQLHVDVISFLDNYDDNDNQQLISDLLRIIHRDKKCTEQCLRAICRDLRHIINHLIPVQSYQVIPFGSSITLLAFRDGDFDIRIAMPQIPDVVTFIKQVRKQLHVSYSFMRPIAITNARVPIIKTTYRATNSPCDLSFCSDPFGIRNTELIRHLISIDDRIQPLFMFIKFWFRVHGYLGSSFLNSYALFNLVTFYLQQLSQPILPAIDFFQNGVPPNIVNGWNIAFRAKSWSNNNTLSIMELLIGFFRFCQEFPFPSMIISTMKGQAYTRDDFVQSADKTWFPRKISILTSSRIYIQDPFILDFNIANIQQTRAFDKFTRHLILMKYHANEHSVLTNPAHLSATSEQLLRNVLLRLYRHVPSLSDKMESSVLSIMPQKNELDICARIYDDLLRRVTDQPGLYVPIVWQLCYQQILIQSLKEFAGARLVAVNNDLDTNTSVLEGSRKTFMMFLDQNIFVSGKFPLPDDRETVKQILRTQQMKNKSSNQTAAIEFASWITSKSFRIVFRYDKFSKVLTVDDHSSQTANDFVKWFGKARRSLEEMYFSNIDSCVMRVDIDEHQLTSAIKTIEKTRTKQDKPKSV